jgi:hypothetical protein
MAGGDPIKPATAKPAFEVEISKSAPGSAAYGAPNFSDIGKSKYDNARNFIDPNYIDTQSLDANDQYNKQMQQLEAGRDEFQPWYDKVGNGLARFGGTLASSILSVPGTIYGIAATPFKGDALWDNVFNKWGDEINKYVQSNTKNYRTLEQQNASPWSPTYWANLNFFTEQILGNAGYAVGAYLTGGGISAALRKLAPVIASGKLKQGLDLMQSGVKLDDMVTQVAGAVRRYDRVQAGISLGIAAMSEASIEAKGAYDEFKRANLQKLAEKYSGEENIPDYEYEALDKEARHVGNVVYGINIPILTGANAFQFGKSLLGFKHEANAMRKNTYKIIQDKATGKWATKTPADELAKGGRWPAKIKDAFAYNILPALKNNLSESAQEGLQFIGGAGTKNFYARRYDDEGTATTMSMLDAYTEAANDLFTKEEGVTNLLAGFFTPMMMPVGPGGIFNHRDAIKLFKGDKGVKLKRTNEMLESLNAANIKSNFKEHFETVARDRSIQRDMNTALQSGDDMEARNLEHDRVKNIVGNRIKLGRYDLLKQELEDMMKMEKDEFKAYLGLDADTDIDHVAELKKYAQRAEKMHKTWENLDTIFRPALYRINALSEDKQQEAVNKMEQYKEMAWSYLMDAEDATGREQKLRAEVDTAAVGLFTVGDIFNKKTNDDKFNDLLASYNQALVEHEMHKIASPDKKDHINLALLKQQMNAMKARVRKYIKDNPSVTDQLPDYIAKGDPAFLEDYLFDLEKKFNAMVDAGGLNSMYVANQAMPTLNTFFDMEDFNKKIRDYGLLTKRRMMAINSYNNLATIVKNGTFKDPYVKNPDYTPDNGQKEYIINTEFLESDQYNKIKDARKEYDEQRKADSETNQKEIAAFEADLDTKNSTGNTKFKDLVEQYKKTGVDALDSMDPKELDIFRQNLEMDFRRAEVEGTFDYSTKDKRDNFNHDAYTDLMARQTAFNEILKEHKDKIEKEIQDFLSAVDKQFNTIWEDAGQAAAEQFYQAQRDQEQKNGTPKEILERLDAVIDQSRKAKLGEPEEKDDTIQFVDEDPAAQTGTKPPAGPKPSSEGATPAGVPEPSSEISDITIDKTTNDIDRTLSELVGIPSGTYLMIRRSDLKTEDGWWDVFKAESIFKGYRKSKLLVDNKDEYNYQISGNSITVTDAAGKVVNLDLEQLAKERRLKRRGPVNMYDENGVVQLKQFNADLTDPISELFVRPGTKIRIVNGGKIKDGDNAGFPFAKIEVLDPTTNQWKDTGFGTPMNPALVADQYRAEQLPEAKKQEIRDEVDAVAKLLNDGYTVYASVPENGINVGKLVTNQGDNGNRERFSIFQAFGADFINNSNNKVTGAVMLGVINSDNPVDASIVQMPGNHLVPVQRYHVPQTAIDKLTKNSNGEKAGQMVAILPTAVERQGKTLGIPIMLNTRNLSSDTSSQYLTPGGNPMNPGQALMHVLLNPGDAANADSLRQLFEIVGLQFDPKNPDLKAFYTDDNMQKLTDRLFFSRWKSTKQGTSKYKYPFSIKIESPEEDGSIALSIDVTRDATRFSKRKQGYIHITGKDGNYNTNSVDERLQEYFESNPDAISYDYQELLDVIGRKPYRVDLGLASRPATGAYDAIVFNEEGKLSVQKYPSYLHYLDDKKILEATVQGIESTRTNPATGEKTKRRQYFVNQGIRYVRTNAVKENQAPAKQDTASRPKAYGPAGPAAQPKNSDALAKKLGLTPGSFIEQPGMTTSAEDAIKQAKGQPNANQNIHKLWNEATGKWDRPAVAGERINEPIEGGRYDVFFGDKVKYPNLKVTAVKWINDDGMFYPEFHFENGDKFTKDTVVGKDKVTFRIPVTTTSNTELDAFNKLMDEGKPTSTSKVEPNKQKWVQDFDAAGNLIETPVPATSNTGSKLKNFMKNTPGKAMLNVRDIHSVDQVTIPGLVEQMPLLTRDVHKMALDILLEAYNDKEHTRLSRNEFKRRLRQRIEDSVTKLNSIASQKEHRGDTTIGDRIAAREIILTYFDINDYDQLSKEDKDRVSYGRRIVGQNPDGTPEYKELHFVGFFNLAMNELFKDKIVTPKLDTLEDIDFESEFEMSHTTQFNDNWSFEIDPRDTLSKYGKVIMSTVPQLQLDLAGNATEVRGLMGEPEYLRYSAVYMALLTNVGLVSTPSRVMDVFESIGDPDNPMYYNPVLRSVYHGMQSIRDNPQWGTEVYQQAMRQLLNPLLLQQSDFQIIAWEEQGGRNAKDRSMNMSQQMINDQITKLWSENLVRIIKEGRYVHTMRVQKAGEAPYVVHMMKEDEEGLNIVDYLKGKFKAALNAPVPSGYDKNKPKPKYMGMAEMLVNDLGFHFSDDATVEGTARVLEQVDKQRGKTGNRIFHKYFPGSIWGDTVSQLIEKAVIGTIANESILQTLSNSPDVRSSFNVEAPLANASEVMNSFAKMTRGHFQNVFNPNARDSTGKALYIYNIRNYISQQILNLKDIDYMWTLANSVQGKNNPIISNLFLKDALGEYLGKDQVNKEAFDRWTQMKLNYVREVKRNRFNVAQIKDATKPIWDIAAIKNYQNAERKSDRGLANSTIRQGHGKYLLAFGDATVAPYFEAPKYKPGFDLVKSENGQYRIRLKDKVGDKQVAQTQQLLTDMAVGELQRSISVIREFEAARKAKDFSNLRYGYHYIKVNGKHMPGHGAYIYMLGNKAFEDMRSPESMFFTTTEIGDQRYITGLHDGIFDRNGNLEPYVRDIMQSMMETSINDMIDDQMQKLAPSMKDLLRITPVENEDGTFRLRGYKMPKFDNSYQQTFMDLINGVVFVDDNTSEPGSLASLYKNHLENGKFDEQGIQTESYPALLFKAMIADHVINHAIFFNTFSAAFGQDPALFHKLGKIDYKSFQDNYYKRAKKFVTPSSVPIHSKGDAIHIITFADPRIGDRKVSYSGAQIRKMPAPQRQLMEFLIANESKSKGFIKVERNDKGEVKKVNLPYRTFDNHTEAMWNAHAFRWKGNTATDQTRAAFFDDVVSYWNTESTDGNTYVTLREYLYREYLKGTIDRNEFKSLYNYYSNPNRNQSKLYIPKIKLKGVKSVGTGSKIENGNFLALYKKDGEFVLDPAMTRHNPRIDALRRELEELESAQTPDLNLPSPGIIAAPLSSMKAGYSEPVQIFDDKGNFITGSIKKARIDSWGREAIGEQVLNPIKKRNEVTASTQMDVLVHTNLGTSVRFGENIFTDLAKKITDYSQISSDTQWGGAQMFKEDKPGLTNQELIRSKVTKKMELMKRDLQRLMGNWGLKYEENNEEYNAAVREIGTEDGNLDPEDPRHHQIIREILRDETNPQYPKALAAEMARKRIVTDHLEKMLETIKHEALQRKGLDINQAFALKIANEVKDAMEIPTSFTSSSNQFQNIILSKLEKIVIGRKLPGGSMVQMSGYGYTRGPVEENEELKGYTPIYDKDGNVTGYNPAEIILPWKFKHPKTGEPLDYYTYVDEHGRPKPEMWDEQMLNIIALRIPNTGPNATARMRAVKFFEPGNEDMAAVAPEVVAQMNADFDFDKLPIHIHNFYLDNTGKIIKIPAVIHTKDPRSKDILATDQARRRAVVHTLTEGDMNYGLKVARLETLVNAKINQINDNIEDEEFSDYISSLTLDQQIDFIQDRLQLSDQQMGEMRDLQRYLNMLEEKMMVDFDFDKFMRETPNALSIVQSDQQLQNAIIDTYHVMLSHPEVMKFMLDPLTSDYLKQQVDEKKYNGRSLRDVNEGGTYHNILGVGSMAQMRGSNAGADKGIGIGANSQRIVQMGQVGNLMVGMQKPDSNTKTRDLSRIIVFHDDNKKMIGETEWSEDNSIFEKWQEDKNIKRFYKTEPVNQVTPNEPMRWSHPGSVRFRLNRFYGYNQKGEKVYVTKVVQSLLQAALDNQKDPLLGAGGINEETLDVAVLMAQLRYFDHLMPLINQPIVKEYVAELQKKRSKLMGEGDPGAVITRYMELAGVSGETLNDIQDQVRIELTPKLLNRAIEIQDNKNLPTSYYAAQLHALMMFINLKEVASSQLNLQQALNADTKGLKGVTLVDAAKQISDYKRAKSFYILNSDLVKDSMLTNFKLGYNYMLKPVDDLFNKGEVYMFSELKPAFRIMRRYGGGKESKPQKVNTAIKQFILSDPELYRPILERMGMKQKNITPAMIRDRVMKEHFDIVNGSVTTNNRQPSLASLIEKYNHEVTADGLTVRSVYEILANVRAMPQLDNSRISMVQHQNVNNYKQNLDVLLPASIMNLLRSENKELQLIGNYLIMYAYMAGGTDSPTSFIRSIPQEELVHTGFGNMLRNRMGQLDGEFKDMEDEFYTAARSNEFKEDDRPWDTKLFSGDYIKRNRRALSTLRAFAKQYAQHHWYEHPDFAGMLEEVSPGVYVAKVESRHPKIVRMMEHHATFITKKEQGPEGETSRTVPLVRDYGAAVDFTFVEADNLGINRYSVNEYSFNTSGNEGESVIDRSVAASRYQNAASDEATYMRDRTMVPYKAQLSYRERTPKNIEALKFTAHDMLDWVSRYSDNRSQESAVETVQRVNKGYQQLAEYLKTKIPGNLPVSLEHGLLVNGRPTVGYMESSDTGLYRMRINPDALSRQDEEGELRSLILHEAGHGATMTAIKAVQDFKNKTITAEAAADRLNMKPKEFERIVDAVEKLQTMLTVIGSRRPEMDKYFATQEDQFKLDNALKDVDEFVATVFEDYRFRKALNEMDLIVTKKKRKSILDRIIELFKDILGIREGSALEEALYNILTITESYQPDVSTDLNGNITGKAKEAFTGTTEPFFLETETDLDSTKKSISVRVGRFTPGIYKVKDKLFRVTLRGNKPQLATEQTDKDFAKKVLEGYTPIEGDMLQSFLDGRTAMYIYDIEPIKGDIKTMPDFVGAMAIRPVKAYGADKFTKDPRVDRYIKALTETKVNLMRDLPNVRTDLVRTNELKAQIDQIDKFINLLSAKQDTESIISVGLKVLSQLKDQLPEVTTYGQLHEGLRLTQAYSELNQLIDLALEDPNEEEAKLIEDGKTVQQMAKFLFDDYLKRFKDKVRQDINTNAGTDVSKKVFDESGNMIIFDIDWLGSQGISGEYSANEVEKFVHSLLREAKNRANEEYYQFETELAAKVSDLNGKKVYEANSDDFQFMLEKDKYGRTQLITKFDREFYKELYIMKHLAFEKKQGENYQHAVALGATIEDFKKKVSVQEYYEWERKHFDMVLTEEGKKDYEDYIARIREQEKTGMTPDGKETFNEEEINKQIAKYDPAKFQAFLDGKEKRANQGSRWFTKTMKGIGYSPAYAKLNDKQKAFYDWYVNQILEGRHDLHIDHRFNEADLDSLLLGFTVDLANNMSDKLGYYSKELGRWVGSITHVSYGGTEKIRTPLRTLNGREHIGIEFENLEEFLPERNSVLKLNPIVVLKDFRLSGHKFKNHRMIEDTVNAVRDLVVTAQKVGQMPDGRLRRSLTGAIATSTASTNLGNRFEFNLEAEFGTRIKQPLPPTSTQTGKMKPGEKRFSAWQTLDSINEFTRFKAMALSPLSGIGNLSLGAINNFVYAGSGQYYNDKELSFGYWVTKGSIAKYWSRDRVVTDDARKLAEILFRFNIIGDVTEKMYHDGDKLQWFFTWMKGGEFINQGAAAVAQMVHNKIDGKEFKDGKARNLWEMFKLDANGKVVYQSDLLNEQSNWNDERNLFAAFDKIKKVNDKIHGDYRNALQAKKHLMGRIFLLFRTWLPMAVKERFGAKYNDAVLGDQKGRYVTFYETVPGLKKMVKGIKGLFGYSNEEDNELPFDTAESWKNFGKLTAQIMLPWIRKATGKTLDFNGLEDVDRNNLMIFIREMHFILGLIAACAMLKGLAGDEDDEDKSVLRYIYNQSERAQSELQFFFNPKDNAQILRDLAPMYSTIREAQRVMIRAYNYIEDPEKDVYQRGFRKGQSKLGTSVQELLPVTRSIQKTWSAMSQIYSDKRFE